MITIRTIVAVLTCACFGGAAALCQEPSPDQRLQAILREYNRSTSAPRILTDEERVQFIGEGYRHHTAVSHKLIDLAEKYPNDPVAVDALIRACWQVNTIPWPVAVAGLDDATPKAVALIVQKYASSDKLAPLCERISYGFREEYESLFRAVLKANQHSSVRAAATMGLAHYLFNRSQKVEVVRGNPELSKDYRDLYGEAYLARLLNRKPTSIEAEVTTLLNTATREQGQVELPAGDRVSERARSLLYEMRWLAVGKQAPEIDGTDQDGVTFKLSDYRGKVVLLDFWSFV